MFRTVSLSIIRSLALYTQQYIQVMMTASIICMTYTYCCVYSARLQMMDRETVRNMNRSLRVPDFKPVGTWRLQGFHHYAPSPLSPRKYYR